jgi:Protein of unknown function (DUF2809)
MIPFRRSAFFQFIAIGVVIILGLLSRKYVGIFPAEIAKYPGSALWATAVFFAAGILMRKQSAIYVGAVALIIATLVEFSQLLDIPWLNEIRRTTIGHMFLGSTFNAPDLLAYAIGIGLGCLIELLYFRVHVTR